MKAETFSERVIAAITAGVLEFTERPDYGDGPSFIARCHVTGEQIQMHITPRGCVVGEDVSGPSWRQKYAQAKADAANRLWTNAEAFRREDWQTINK